MFPQGLKPAFLLNLDGAAEATPLQNIVFETSSNYFKLFCTSVLFAQNMRQRHRSGRLDRGEEAGILASRRQWPCRREPRDGGRSPKWCGLVPLFIGRCSFAL